MGLFDKRRRVKAIIVRIWNQPPPGAPCYYWTFVLFDSNGERIKIHLKKGQAKGFVDVSAEGDVGYLDFKGNHMYAWERTKA